MEVSTVERKFGFVLTYLYEEFHKLHVILIKQIFLVVFTEDAVI